MPSQAEMEHIEANTPVRIPDLVAGHFVGMIEETETVLDDQGQERTDMFNLIVRVSETGNQAHIGKLMIYSLYLKDKKGRFNPRTYRWIAALHPDVLKGGAFHPTYLHMIEFEAEVKYNGKYWNLESPKFRQRHEDFGFGT
jgi:hypothetical protein